MVDGKMGLDQECILKCYTTSGASQACNEAEAFHVACTLENVLGHGNCDHECM